MQHKYLYDTINIICIHTYVCMYDHTCSACKQACWVVVVVNVLPLHLLLQNICLRCVSNYKFIHKNSDTLRISRQQRRWLWCWCNNKRRRPRYKIKLNLVILKRAEAKELWDCSNNIPKYTVEGKQKQSKKALFYYLYFFSLFLQCLQVCHAPSIKNATFYCCDL